MSQSAGSTFRSHFVTALLVALLSFAATGAFLRATRPPPAGVITLRVLNPEGEPARCNASIWAVREDGGRVLTGDASKRCDEDGVLRWEGLSPGRWRVMAYVEDCEQLDRELELGAQHGLDDGDNTVGWGGMVIGTVTEAGQPVDGAEVRTASGRSFTTATNGAYKLDGLPMGEVEIRAAKGFSGGSAKTVVTRGGRSVVDIELTPVPPRGVVGIGVELVEGQVRVTKVAPGSPAEGQIEPGDVLVSIEGQGLEGDLTLTRRLLAGEPGQAVQIQLRRGDEVLERQLTRASVQEL